MGRDVGDERSKVVQLVERLKELAITTLEMVMNQNISQADGFDQIACQCFG